MKFYILISCLAVFVVYVFSERCGPHDDLGEVCVLTACVGNNTKMICEHEECTCAINTDIPCTMKSDCTDILKSCGDDGPGHHHHKRAKGDKEWHCLDSFCKCF